MSLKLFALLLLAQPCCAQFLLANAGDGTINNFAPGSLVLVGDLAVQDVTTATLTIASSMTVPVLTKISNGIGLARLPANLSLGTASAYLTINGKNTDPISFNVVSSSFAIFTGPISASLFSVILAGAPASSGGVFFYVNSGSRFAQKNNGPMVGLTQPAHPGDYLTIYGTGLGTATASQVSVSVAGLPVPVTYAGPAPGQPGVDQINVYLAPKVAAPDSCSDAFTVSIAGTAIAPKALSYTQTAASCSSAAGFNSTELAQIDAGTQVPFVQLLLFSGISPATTAGFIRAESALALQLNSSEGVAPLDIADSVLYSCQTQQSGPPSGRLAAGYSGLTLSMGSTSIPVGQILPVSPTALTPDAVAPGLFQAGTWQLSAPNFSQSLQLPPTIQLQNFNALQSIDTARDLTITWDRSGYASTDVLSLNIAAPPTPWFTSSSVACHAPASAGSLVIPAAQLQPIPQSATLTATVTPRQTPNFRLPQPDGSTLALQVSYDFIETFPVTLH